MEEPFCELCAHPNVDILDCNDHEHLDYIDRMYAMGWYIPVNSRAANDLLSRHILRAKDNISFISPLGLAMIIAARTRYHELLDYDLIMPIPLHEWRTWKKTEILTFKEGDGKEGLTR